MLIEACILFGGVFVGAVFAPNRSPEPKQTDDGTIKWGWSYENHGHQCPKCRVVTTYTKSPRLEFCDCGEHVRSHFHFVCSSCKFKAIMRTADEP